MLNLSSGLAVWAQEQVYEVRAAKDFSSCEDTVAFQWRSSPTRAVTPVRLSPDLYTR